MTEGGIAIIRIRRIQIAVVSDIEMNRHHHLFAVVQTVNLLRLGLGLGQHGQQHARQDGNDGDNNQQFDKRKGSGLEWVVNGHGTKLSPHRDLSSMRRFGKAVDAWLREQVGSFIKHDTSR